MRTAVESLIQGKFNGNMSAAARAMHVTPTALSDIRKGKRGVGLGLAIALAEQRGETLDALLGRRGQTTPESSSTLARLPGWQAAVAAAASRVPLPSWAYTAAGAVSGLVGFDEASEALVLDVAMIVLKHGPRTPPTPRDTRQHSSEGGGASSAAGQTVRRRRRRARGSKP